MPKVSTVSVIIPTRDRLKFTSEAIQSILNQNLPDDINIEIIVVDDCSKVPLKKQLDKKYPQVKFIRNKVRKSHGGSRNVGIKHAGGEYIAFLDSDDQWKPNFITQSLKEIKRPGSIATVCLTDPYFHGNYSLSEKLKLHLLNLARMLVLYTNWLFNKKRLPQSGFYLCQISHMLFKKNSVKKNRFNEKVLAAEDWEFVANVSSSKEIGIVLSPLVDFRYVKSSNTNTQAVRKMKWQAYQNLLQRLPSTHIRGILNILFHLYIKAFS